MDEQLELVTDFATLRIGMLCKADCRGCGRRHRFILGPLGKSNDGDLAFETLPNAHPDRGRGVLCRGAVDARLVFRVVDPEVTQVSKKRARERAK